MLEALAHAHARGIVHRDVKPSNVLLAEGKDVSARVLDFGLAKMREAETLTAQGDVPGTLAYIAPERLGGGPTMAAADVWAVGVMLWEALAGRHPFWRSSLLETARAIEDGAPPLEAERPDLPKPLLAAVNRALDIDPARRPDAASLAATLRLAGRKRRRKTSGPTVPLVVPAVLPRVAPAVLAGLLAGWAAFAIPFFPSGWGLGLGALALGLTLADARIGLAFALAVPILPLGNVAMGAAILYALAAAGLLAVSWREPRSGALFVIGPLLAPLSMLALVPLACLSIRSPARRALQCAIAVADRGPRRRRAWRIVSVRRRRASRDVGVAGATAHWRSPGSSGRAPLATGPRRGGTWFLPPSRSRFRLSAGGARGRWPGWVPSSSRRRSFRCQR